MFTHCGGSKVEWLPGIIEAASGPLSYVIRLTDGRTVKRHVDHIRERHVDIPDPLSRSYTDSKAGYNEHSGSNGSARRSGSPRYSHGASRHAAGSRHAGALTGKTGFTNCTPGASDIRSS